MVTLDILLDRRRRPGRHGSYVELKRSDLVRLPSGPFRPRPLSFRQHSAQEFLHCSRRPAQLSRDFVNVRSPFVWLTRPLKNQLCFLGGPASHGVEPLLVPTSTEATLNGPGEVKF